MRRRKVAMKVLPGEPLDGSGRVCIHLFVQDATGPFTESHALHPMVKDGQQVGQQLEARPTRGRLACDRRRLVAPVTQNGVTAVTSRTDDARAVTCPRCMESIEYAAAMLKFEPQQVEGN